MKIGTTGTRHGRDETTQESLARLLVEWGATEFHHGDCVGWDQQAHNVAKGLGIRIVVHPPKDEGLRAFCDADEVLPPLPYLDRNKRIVDTCDKLIAAPDGPERARSGTWSTVRYAKKVGVRGIVLTP